MRISSLSYFTSSLPSMQDNQSQIARLSEQISTGQRMLAAKDDPISAGKALRLSSSIAVREQYAVNQQKATLALDSETVVLQAMNTALTDARALLAQTPTGNTQAEQDTRNQNAVTLAGYYTNLKDFLNSRDSDGHYIFAGFQTATQPFVHTQQYPAIANSAATTYNGTADAVPPAQISTLGVRSISIDDGHKLQVSDNLENVVKYPAASPVTLATSTPPGSVTATDILQTLDQIAVTLKDSSLTSAQIGTNLTNAISGFDTTLGNLGGIQRRVAAAGIEVNAVKTTTQSLQVIEQNALSNLTQVNQAAAIIELQTRQTALQAAQQAYAQTSKLSLFSYL